MFYGIFGSFFCINLIWSIILDLSYIFVLLLAPLYKKEKNLSLIASSNYYIKRVKLRNFFDLQQMRMENIHHLSTKLLLIQLKMEIFIYQLSTFIYSSEFQLNIFCHNNVRNNKLFTENSRIFNAMFCLFILFICSFQC